MIRSVRASKGKAMFELMGKWEAGQALRDFGMVHSFVARGVKDTDVTAADIAAGKLVLSRRQSSNALYRRIAERCHSWRADGVIVQGREVDANQRPVIFPNISTEEVRGHQQRFTFTTSPKRHAVAKRQTGRRGSPAGNN